MLLHPSGFPCFGPAFAPQAKLLPSAQESLSAECQGIADDTLPGRHPHLNNRMEEHPCAGLCLGASTFKRWDRHSSIAAPCPPTASASLQTRMPTSSSSNIPKTRPHINDVRAQKVMKLGRKNPTFRREIHSPSPKLPAVRIHHPAHMSCVYCKLPEHQSPLHSREARFRV